MRGSPSTQHLCHPDSLGWRTGQRLKCELMVPQPPPTPNKSKVLLLPFHIPETSTLSSLFPLCPEIRLLKWFMPKPSVLVSPGLLQCSEWHLLFWTEACSSTHCPAPGLCYSSGRMQIWPLLFLATLTISCSLDLCAELAC